MLTKTTHAQSQVFQQFHSVWVMAIRNWVWDSSYKFYKNFNLNMEKLSEFRAWKFSSLDSDNVDGKKNFFWMNFWKKVWATLKFGTRSVSCIIKFVCCRNNTGKVTGRFTFQNFEKTTKFSMPGSLPKELQA